MSMENAERSLDVLATLLGQKSLLAAATVLAETWAHQMQAGRVSIGLRLPDNPDECRLLATSSAAVAAQLSREQRAMVDAMDEAIDQGVVLSWPAPAGAQPHIVVAHAALAKLGAPGICTIPLVVDGEAFGAVCLEWSGSLPEPAVLANLTHQSCLLAPVLQLLLLNERSTWRRLLDVWRAWLAHLRSPAGGRWRLAVILGCLLPLLGLLLPVAEKVGGKARLEGQIQRVLVAPVDGYVKAVHARPGDDVKEGQLLVEMAGEELGLDRQKWEGELAQYENAYAAAFARSDRTEMIVNQARANEARTRLALTESHLARSRLVAPFAGLLIQGDLSRALGAPVRRGDVLVTLAPRDAYRVIVDIDERDIAKVALGQPGELTVSALPWDSLPITVTRITPLATAVEGANVFEVEASLDQAPAHLQPGLQGQARLRVGSSAVLPRLFGCLLSELRLRSWSWWG